MAQSIVLIDGKGNMLSLDNLGRLTAKTESEDYVTLIDDVVVTNKTFIGKAPPGSVESDLVWKIKCIDETGSYMKVGYAEGSKNFDKIWNNRTDYVYS